MTRMEAICIIIQKLLDSEAEGRIVAVLNALGVSESEIIEVLS